MYSFIIVSIGSNNRSFLRIHFSKIWTHGCIQTGSWKISAYGKMDRRGIVMSCRHLLEVYRLWRVSFQLDIWNCTPNGFLKFQCVSRGPVTTKTRSTKRVPIKGTQAGQISTRKKGDDILTPPYEKGSLGHMSRARNPRIKSGGWRCHEDKCYFTDNFCTTQIFECLQDSSLITESDLQSFIKLYICFYSLKVKIFTRLFLLICQWMTWTGPP